MTQEIRIEPTDPDAARAEIERTRLRMSTTIDEIEEVLVRKKDRLRNQLDVGARIREKPLHAAGIVLAGGLLLGLISGGRRNGGGGGQVDADERVRHWEARARRLLAIAQAQEEEIEDLEDALSTTGRVAIGVRDWQQEKADFYDPGMSDVEDLEEEEEDDEEPSRFGAFKELITERVADFVSETSRHLLQGIRDRR